MFLLLRARSCSPLFELSSSCSSFARPIATPATTAIMPPRRSGVARATTTTKAATTTESRPRRAAAAAATSSGAAAVDAPAIDVPAPAAATTTKPKSGPTRDRESRLWAKGHAHVAGVDEAGRGPLAGPVVAAACVLPRDANFPGLDDSKQLDEPSREALYAALTAHPGVAWCVRVEDHVSIDRINILQATMRAMRRAVDGLAHEGDDENSGNDENNNSAAAADLAAVPDPRARRSLLRLKADYALIDGNRVPGGLPCPAEAVVGGDGKVSAIAAASVLAKVTRDRIMVDLEMKYPGYGLGQHKGYGVPQHVAAVRRLGPSEVHRRSFQPVKGMVGWTREAMLLKEEAAAAAARAAGAAGAATGAGAAKGAGAAAKGGQVPATTTKRKGKAKKAGQEDGSSDGRGQADQRERAEEEREEQEQAAGKAAAAPVAAGQRGKRAAASAPSRGVPARKRGAAVAAAAAAGK